MQEYRCQYCHRLLAKIEEGGKIEIKCPKCKSLNLYSENKITVIEIDEEYLQKKVVRGKVNYDLLKN
jgi:phage FluMu protein Com